MAVTEAPHRSREGGTTTPPQRNAVEGMTTGASGDRSADERRTPPKGRPFPFAGLLVTGPPPNVAVRETDVGVVRSGRIGLGNFLAQAVYTRISRR